MTAMDCVNRLQFPHTEPSPGYHQITAKDDHEEVGWIRWKNEEPSEFTQPGEVTALGVASEYQHQGVATRMYHEAQKYSPVVHSKTRTPAGDAFAKKVGGPALPVREEGLMAPMDPPPIKWVR